MTNSFQPAQDREAAIATISWLQDTELKILMLIYLKDSPVTQSWLIGQMGKSGATIKKYLRRLEYFGYVEHLPSDDWQLANNSWFGEQ